MAKLKKKKVKPQKKIKGKASKAASKGWETRRARALEQERIRRAKNKVRRQREHERAEKEAKRLAKWRKSYRKYLEFRVSKVEREELEVPAKKELVCRVLFDSEALEFREEEIWTNIEYRLGPSINKVLSKVPGEIGIVKTVFRLIEGEEYSRMQRGTLDDMDEEDYGVRISLEWDLDIEPRLFWSTYYSHARTLIPNRPELKGQDYKASWLGVVRMELCYEPGEAEEE